MNTFENNETTMKQPFFHNKIFNQVTKNSEILISSLVKDSFSFNKRPRCSLNFEALRCGAYWNATLKREKCSFQSKRNYSHKTSKLCLLLFRNNSK